VLHPIGAQPLGEQADTPAQLDEGQRVEPGSALPVAQEIRTVGSE
jgi:hypothetical protein